jgi:hypothetical protein
LNDGTIESGPSRQERSQFVVLATPFEQITSISDLALEGGFCESRAVNVH